MPNYTVASEAPFHYPDGVACTGESISLASKDAARGLGAGTLVPIKNPAPKVPSRNEDK